MIRALSCSIAIVFLTGFPQLESAESATTVAADAKEPRPISKTNISGIASLQITKDKAVRLVSDGRTLRHLLKDGSEFCHTAYIQAETGKVVNTPEKGLKLTLQIGETVFFTGWNTHLQFKLVRIEKGKCVFEKSGYDRGGRPFKSMILVAPY
jgi:hypothetical protein